MLSSSVCSFAFYFDSGIEIHRDRSKFSFHAVIESRMESGCPLLIPVFNRCKDMYAGKFRVFDIQHGIFSLMLDIADVSRLSALVTLNSETRNSFAIKQILHGKTSTDGNILIKVRNEERFTN